MQYTYIYPGQLAAEERIEYIEYPRGSVYSIYRGYILCIVQVGVGEVLMWRRR